jgi:nicotinate dehydrogenase subunit B
MIALAKRSQAAPAEPIDIQIFSAALSRRGFVKAGGTLFATLGFARANAMQEQAPAQTAAPTQTLPSSSWIEIHSDNTILLRTGKSDFGQSTVFTAYRQIVADELYVPFESITSVISGDTDRTPDGGGTFDLLMDGMPNVRKAAAYVHQALLDLAAQQLGVSKDQLKVRDGIVSGGGKSISYGDLVKGQNLNLTIPVKGDIHSMFGLVVAGNPPLKPVSEYTVVGKSFANPAVVPKVSAKETWITDVRVPGMLHARVVHPKTLGSKLVAAGTLDTARFPNAKVIVKNNLVGVVAPTEWEAIKAAEQVAAGTKWSDWHGLPGDARLFHYLKEDTDWKAVPSAVSKESKKGDVAAVIAGSPKKLKATYERPYLKHAPIGPVVAVGDVRSDGSIHLHAHTQNAQALRSGIAQMLSVSPDKVVVHTYAGAGHYGRSNGGNAGAEDEAVILSQISGKPVRVQWMRNDDLQWSTQSSCAFSDVELAISADGKLSAYQIDHFMPAMQDDRLVGAILAGLPTIPAPNEKGSLFGMRNEPGDPWLYDGTTAVLEQAHGASQVGQVSSPINVGLRDHSLRTPGQYQQNFPREVAITEAAYLAGADPLDFRLGHTTNKRVIGVLEAARDGSGWVTRSGFAHSDGAIKRGQGVSLMQRTAYWACVAQIAVDTSNGVIKVERITMVVDPGIVINPFQMKRQVEGGTIMGVGMTLHEELRFDESGVTSSDWRSYPIATMADLPEIKVVLLHRPEVGSYAQGSEAANALAAPAIASAFFDATGKIARRLPLKPEYVQSLLKA